MSTRSTKTRRRKSERFNRFVVGLQEVKKAAIKAGNAMEDLSESFARAYHRTSGVFRKLNSERG